MFEHVLYVFVERESELGHDVVDAIVTDDVMSPPQTEENGDLVLVFDPSYVLS